MAIKPGDTITYRELVDNFYSWLTTNCKNIGSYASDVGESLKVGGSFSRTTTYNAAKATLTPDSNSQIPTVQLSSVKNEFENFMKERGVWEKLDMIATTKGILNFWNNVSAFCSTKLVYISSFYETAPKMMYKAANTSFPSVPVVDDGEEISAADVLTLLSNMETSVNRDTKSQTVVFNIAMACCSCSSSSSSSCSSSSSSSSSSSMFIAYMKI